MGSEDKPLEVRSLGKTLARWRSETGLPEMMGTRPARKVAVTRGNSAKSPVPPCYYVML
jgi:hypothetical protein